MLALGIALPASAAVSGVSAATITVQGGALSITVPTTAGNLGTRPNSVGGGTISGSLGQVQVSDARSAAAGSSWVASVISSAFTPPTGTAIAASAVGYTAGTITKVGTATYTANDPADLTGVAPAVTATGITGDNSATWNPTINVPSRGAWPPVSTPPRSPTPSCMRGRARPLRPPLCSSPPSSPPPRAHPPREPRPGQPAASGASDCGSSTHRRAH